MEDNDDNAGIIMQWKQLEAQFVPRQDAHSLMKNIWNSALHVVQSPTVYAHSLYSRVLHR